MSVQWLWHKGRKDFVTFARAQSPNCFQMPIPASHSVVVLPTMQVILHGLTPGQTSVHSKSRHTAWAQPSLDFFGIMYVPLPAFQCVAAIQLSKRGSEGCL
ncbi:hypothetical protein P280DRAFT_179859 [Massarina eburnea CBS 473.64]|uniref:Uncharacterized protein n=1 Tax=Massarina eburnea CBS 473.64 TaxID=1395130 RepID=A0A6A6SAH6_9PLEO|nr:hypothetical protein P280DRAFT_179859 [Massarina eburnea CBS 473.64]